MTSLTQMEIKMVSFGFFFIAIVTAFVALYYSNPIQKSSYAGESSVTAGVTSGSSSWISGVIGVLPAPFDDSALLIVVSIFITPVVIMLGYIAVRALKDLITQWV